MAVSKRLRYEILRRDNHACRYCGATAPDVALTVDHIVPTTLGGSDEPANLVAACADCNNGKSATPPDAAIVDDVAADALRWAQAMQRAAEIQDEEHNVLVLFWSYFKVSWERWKGGDGEPLRLPTNWEQSITAFRRAGLGAGDLDTAIADAMRASHIPQDRVWRYFCGICWRVVEQRREIAASLIQADEVPTDAS